MPWQEHCNIMRAIARTGIPRIAYGVIIGLPDDSHESLLYLEEGIFKLSQELKEINPEIDFKVRPFSISPFAGTPQEKEIRESGLLACDDPTIVGGLWTACANTKHMSYLEVSQWQVRLMNLGDKSNALFDLSNTISQK